MIRIRNHLHFEIDLHITEVEIVSSFIRKNFKFEMTTRLFTLIKSELFKSWWVFLFALLCFICYEQGIKVRDEQYRVLLSRLKKMKKEKLNALALQVELSDQVRSQENNARIEYLLMKELGVAPEGYKKIYFIK